MRPFPERHVAFVLNQSMGMEADIGSGLPEPAGNDHTTMGDFVDNKHRSLENDKEIDKKIRLY